MLSDVTRLELYAAALREVVGSQTTVLDVGAGTGVLSVMAAMAGANKVYAVEKTPVARLAKEIVERNGFGDRITVLQADMNDVELPSQVDIIVSELLGGVGVDENFAELLIGARERWLKPGGQMIPSTVKTFLSVGQDDVLSADLTFFRSDKAGLNLTLLADYLVNQVQYRRHHIRDADLLGPAVCAWTADYSKDPLERLLQFTSECKFRVEKPGHANAIIGWFSARLGPNTTISTGPGTVNSWGMNVYPLAVDRQFAQDEIVHIMLKLRPAEPGWMHSEWAVGTQSYVAEHHDSQHATICA